ncbi:MAG: hypothetical protein Q9N02_04715, partial [Ghiorsea sp.]|nr:hypothetical protein [Ghiorsea sp.]
RKPCTQLRAHLNHRKHKVHSDSLIDLPFTIIPLKKGIHKLQNMIDVCLRDNSGKSIHKSLYTHRGIEAQGERRSLREHPGVLASPFLTGIRFFPSNLTQTLALGYSGARLDPHFHGEK